MTDEIRAAVIQGISTIAAGILAGFGAWMAVNSWRREAPGRTSVTTATKCLTNVYLLQDRFARSASTSFDQQDFTESGMDLDAYVTVKSKEKLEPIADLVRDLRSATIEHRVFLDGSKQAPIMAAYRLMRKAYNLALENRKRYLRISLNSKHDPAAIEWAESYGYDSKSFRHPERDATPRSLATQSMAAYEAILRPLLRTTWRPSQVLKSDLHSINVGSTAKQAHTPWWQQPPW